MLVVLIKNAVHLLMTSTGAVGELSNFICGASFVFAFGSVFHRAALSKNKYLHLLLSLIVGCAVQIIAAVLGNYFLMIPLYGIQAAAGSYIFGGVIPFNFVKDLLVSIVFAVVYLNVYPHIDRYVSRNPVILSVFYLASNAFGCSGRCYFCSHFTSERLCQCKIRSQTAINLKKTM